jgi:hypothetical protein
MKTTLPILALAFIHCGCAGMGGGVTSTHDEFADKTINQTQKNNLPMALTDAGAMELDARQEVDAQGNAQYFLILSSVSLGPAVLIPAQLQDSLLILADGKHYSFASSSHQGSAFFYPVTKEQLLEICNAASIKVRVIQITGKPYENEFNANNRATFKEFAAKFLSN